MGKYVKIIVLLEKYVNEMIKNDIILLNTQTSFAYNNKWTFFLSFQFSI